MLEASALCHYSNNNTNILLCIHTSGLATISWWLVVTLNNASEYYWTISGGLTGYRTNGLGLGLGV